VFTEEPSQQLTPLPEEHAEPPEPRPSVAVQPTKEETWTSAWRDVGVSFGVWIASVVLLLIVPLLYSLPYLVYRIAKYGPPTPEALATDKQLIFYSVIGIIPTHMLTFVIVWLLITYGGRRPFWKNIDFGQRISNALVKPVRLVNDADQLGLGVVSGKGYEIAVTLGTGFGTAFLIDGYLLPHMELAHHPIRKDTDYDAYIGERAQKEVGKEKWNKRVEKVLEILKVVFNYDRLYIGGGEAQKLKVPLGENMILFSNQDGIRGGAKLWLMEDKYHISTNHPVQS